MQISKRGLMALLVVGIVCSAQAQLIKIPTIKLPWNTDSSSKGPAPKHGGKVQTRLNMSIQAIGSARKRMLEAQITLAKSLGLKEAADDILSNAKILGEGGVVQQPKDVDGIENSVKASEELSKIMATAAAQAAPLDKEGKILFQRGKEEFGKGLLAEAGQITVLAALLVDIKTMTDKSKSGSKQPENVVALVVPAAELAALTTGDVKEMAKTWSLIRQIGANNNIPVKEIDVSKYLSGPDAT